MDLTQLERQLLEEHKLPIYKTQVAAEKATTDEEKEVIAVRILKSSLPVALSMYLQEEARKRSKT